MYVKAKIGIKSNGKWYSPGEVLEISAADFKEDFFEKIPELTKEKPKPKEKEKELDIKNMDRQQLFAEIRSRGITVSPTKKTEELREILKSTK